MCLRALAALPTKRAASVFVAPPTNPAVHPRELAPMEHMAQDDELVYAVPSACLPKLRFTRGLAGKRSLDFEGLLAGVYVEALAGSGATHSFDSSKPLHDNGIAFNAIDMPEARMDDGTAVSILGATSLKLGPVLVRHRFLVVDMDA